MTWIGYNTQASLEDTIRPSKTWTESTTPKLSRVEEINKQIYNEINLNLESEGISIDSLTDADLEILAGINDYGSSAIIEKIIREKIPQKVSDNEKIPSSWGATYEKKLQNFIKLKKKKSGINLTSSNADFTTKGTGISTTPIFKIATEW